ncbi:MAG TPA: hypothetical protein VFR67_17600, partial [Pilimelia sp.]|nr:hypothetical protein [Pilimelia sp.]
MSMRSLEPVAGLPAGEWIAEALPGLLGTVASVVPRRFTAYARVLHPVEFHDGRAPLTWAQVCQITGRVPHPLMQWAAITTPAAATAGTPAPGRWEDGDARVGTLEPSALAALVDVLAPATGEQNCFHALWEGWGWVDAGVPPEVWALSRLRLPDRSYLLFRGPLRAALEMGWRDSVMGFDPQSPSLLWPADRSW